MPDTSEYYDRYWKDGVHGWSVSAALSDGLRSLLEGVATGADVVDLGGGDGARYGHVLRSVARTYTVVDVSHDVLRARAAMGDRTVHVEALPKMTDAFDALVCLDVLEHVVDPLEILREGVSTLRKNGKALVSVPNAFSWWNRARMVAGRLPSSGVGVSLRGRHFLAPHIRLYDRASLLGLVESAGLAVVEEYADGLDLWRATRFASKGLRPLRLRSPLLPMTFVVLCQR